MANVVNLYGSAASIPLDELASMSKAQLVQCATILHSAMASSNRGRFALQRELDMTLAAEAGAPAPERQHISDVEGRCAALEAQLRESRETVRRVARENGDLKRMMAAGGFGVRPGKDIGVVAGGAGAHESPAAATPAADFRGAGVEPPPSPTSAADPGTPPPPLVMMASPPGGRPAREMTRTQSPVTGQVQQQANRAQLAQIAGLQDELARAKGELLEQARLVRLREPLDAQFLRSVNEAQRRQAVADRERIADLVGEINNLKFEVDRQRCRADAAIREVRLLASGGGGSSLLDDAQGGDGAPAASAAGITVRLLDAECQTDPVVARVIDLLRAREDELKAAQLELQTVTERCQRLADDARDMKRESIGHRHDAQKYAGLVAEMQQQLKQERTQKVQRALNAPIGGGSSAIFSASPANPSGAFAGTGIWGSGTSSLPPASPAHGAQRRPSLRFGDTLPAPPPTSAVRPTFV